MVRCLPVEPWELNLQQVALGADCSQLTAWEGNWERECQVLMLQAWLITVTVLHKINLFFPSFPTSVSWSCIWGMKCQTASAHRREREGRRGMASHA